MGRARTGMKEPGTHARRPPVKKISISREGFADSRSCENECEILYLATLTFSHIFGQVPCEREGYHRISKKYSRHSFS